MIDSGEKERISDVPSSQESLPLSQDTFELLFNQVKEQWPQASHNLDSSFFVPANGTENKEPSPACSLSEQACAFMPGVEQPVAVHNHVPSSLPAIQSWLGDYEFSVSFGPQEKNTKGMSWTYSELKHKLYVGKDVPCPVNFSTNCQMGRDVHIRTMALFSSAEHIKHTVHRCVNHSMEEINKGVPEAEHLIRCDSSSAFYETDLSGRHSVVVPFENPPAGELYSTYIYKFACFGSCAGGPNRRPLMLIFTLEKGKEVIGRQRLAVKICACPGRDRKAEELPFVEKKEETLKRKDGPGFISLGDVFDFTKHIMIPAPKKAKRSEDGIYTLSVRDPQCYEFLKQMKMFYEICQQMQKKVVYIENKTNEGDSEN